MITIPELIGARESWQSIFFGSCRIIVYRYVTNHPIFVVSGLWRKLKPVLLISSNKNLRNARKYASFWLNVIVKIGPNEEKDYGASHENSRYPKTYHPAHVVLDVNHDGLTD